MWASGEYFVTAGSLVYCLGLASGDPEGDAETFDAVAAQFEIATETVASGKRSLPDGIDA